MCSRFLLVHTSFRFVAWLIFEEIIMNETSNRNIDFSPLYWPFRMIFWTQIVYMLSCAVVVYWITAKFNLNECTKEMAKDTSVYSMTTLGFSAIQICVRFLNFIGCLLCLRGPKEVKEGRLLAGTMVLFMCVDYALSIQNIYQRSLLVMAEFFFWVFFLKRAGQCTGEPKLEKDSKLLFRNLITVITFFIMFVLMGIISDRGMIPFDMEIIMWTAIFLMTIMSICVYLNQIVLVWRLGSYFRKSSQINMRDECNR